MSDQGAEMQHVESVDPTAVDTHQQQWDATTEAAAAAAAAAAATVAATAIQEGHPPTGTTPDPVLAAATAAAMGQATAPGAVDASATEAAVALGAAAVGGEEEEEEEEEEETPAGGSKTRKNFDDRLKELRKFKQKHGHCNVPHKYQANPQLGTWVDTQRRLYRNNKRYPAKPTTLTPENIEKLNDLGFNFEPRPSREETWNTRLVELANYKAQHGHCNVREDDQSFPGLGKWVSYVRRQYRLMRQGRRPKDSKRLDTGRINQLREVGFVFELREEMAHKRYREGIASLRQFRDEEGHVQVPSFYERNPTLGLVVEEMKREATKIQSGQPSTMTTEMVAELVELGLVGEVQGMPPQVQQQAQADANAAAVAAAEQAVAKAAAPASEQKQEAPEAGEEDEAEGVSV